MASLRLVAVALLILSLSLPSGRPDLASDTAALVALRDAVGRSALRSWNSSVPACKWPGVSCVSGRVRQLRIPGAGLIGQIPSAVGNLTALRTLSLRFNALAGPLPPEFAGLAELRNLYLQDNRLAGEIPAFLASLKNLVRLDLADNRFTGRIPPELNNLTRLGTLYLQGNQLHGEIPALPNIAQFNVSYNELSGSIPASLRFFPRSAFLNTSLCGGPLGPCPNEIVPAPPAEGAFAVNASGGVVDSGKKKKLSGGAIAGIAIGGACLVFVLVVVLVLLCSERKSQSSGAASADAKPKEMRAIAEQRDKEGLPGGGNGNGNGEAVISATAAFANSSSNANNLVFFGSARATRPFDLEDLLRASAEVLGKGTFGTTYKAVLESGMTVAVKRLKEVNLQERELKEKIEDIGVMDHPNLVPLMAYYFSKDEKLLVYEYVPMGSLSALLHGNRGSGQTLLDWETRTGIVLAAARGLEYIHSTSPSASHGNIKSSNILLTKSYEARVSDHCLAVLVGSTSSTSGRVAGYRAPEVTDPQTVSQKADVYSFGVLLLELLTGKAPAQVLMNEEGVDLPRWVQSVIKEEWTAKVFDVELLRYKNVEENMVQLLQLAIDCVAQYPDKRPSMCDVVLRIDEIRKSSLASSYQDHQSALPSIEGSISNEH
ncbi:putative inactive receptor kinase At1g48480 [Curcuma longa]|uniref:putative inactive receptor kinase At1g48480 n=1 Tax=Curcuma longa TaxID=136217 RepID=UPI003D9F118F